MSAQKFDYRCPECGSRDVCVESASSWDMNDQCWVHTYAHDTVICQSCGKEGEDEFRTPLD